MFIQVLRGRVRDPVAVRAAVDSWLADCRPGAWGWVDLTAGVAEDGTFILISRFISARAAEANDGRRQQRQWWAATSGLMDSTAQRYDCPIVDVLIGGVRPDAGFVQVEAYTGVTDVVELRAVDKQFERLARLRPDLLGVTTAVTVDGHAFAANYFTCEADARAAEAREWPPEVLALVRRVDELTDSVEYIDLRTPWVYT